MLVVKHYLLIVMIIYNHGLLIVMIIYNHGLLIVMIIYSHGLVALCQREFAVQTGISEKTRNMCQGGNTTLIS